MTVIDFRSDGRITPEDRRYLREFTAELGGDPVVLARRLGLKVYEEDLHESVSGYLSFDQFCGSATGYKIVINRSHSIGRRKFTVAHELGHYVLHRNSPELQRKKRESADILDFPSGHPRSVDDWHYEDYPVAYEREADAFAATLLLPLYLLRKTPEFQQGQPVALAKRLDFSPGFVAMQFKKQNSILEFRGGCARPRRGSGRRQKPGGTKRA